MVPHSTAFCFFEPMNKTIAFLFITAIFCCTSSFKSFPVYSKSDLLGQLEPEKHPAYSRVPDAYTTQSTFLRTEALEAFLKMHRAAQKAGVNLYIVSGTRNRARQIEIWMEKWNRFTGDTLERLEEILQYSSMPGTSRHHWGTDFDLNSVDSAYFETADGAKIYAWLAENAFDYGFYQPYVKKGEARQNGYREEKWHWSYYPISNQMLIAYKRVVSYRDIRGFAGSNYAERLNVIGHFVEGLPDFYAQNLEYFETAAENASE